jgi:hypothetical protein
MTKTQHTQGAWKFRVTKLSGELGNSYAVDLPNGATIFSSSNDDAAEAHMRLVAAVPHLVRACRLLLKAYADAAYDEHVDWNDVDIAQAAATTALGSMGESSTVTDSSDPQKEEYVNAILRLYRAGDESVLREYEDCYERDDDEDESEEDYVTRCAYLDFADGEDAVVFREIYRLVVGDMS